VCRVRQVQRAGIKLVQVTGGTLAHPLSRPPGRLLFQNLAVRSPAIFAWRQQAARLAQKLTHWTRLWQVCSELRHLKGRPWTRLVTFLFLRSICLRARQRKATALVQKTHVRRPGTRVLRVGNLKRRATGESPDHPLCLTPGRPQGSQQWSKILLVIPIRGFHLDRLPAGIPAGPAHHLQKHIGLARHRQTLRDGVKHQVATGAIPGSLPDLLQAVLDHLAIWTQDGFLYSPHQMPSIKQVLGRMQNRYHPSVFQSDGRYRQMRGLTLLSPQYFLDQPGLR